MPSKANKGTVVPFPRAKVQPARKNPVKKRKGVVTRKHNQVDPAFQAITYLLRGAIKDGVTLSQIVKKGRNQFSEQMLYNWLKRGAERQGTCRLDKAGQVLKALDKVLQIDGEAY